MQWQWSPVALSLVWGGMLVCVVSSCAAGPGEYSLVYGGVLALPVKNISMDDADIKEAVNLAVKGAKLAGVRYSLSNMEKQRLYYTVDGIEPFLHKQFYSNHSAGPSGLMYMQRNQLVMGLMYTFTINFNHSGEEREFHFAVSRDRNKDFHIFKQTSAHPQDSSLMHTCINMETVFPLMTLLPLQLRTYPSTSAQAVKVASYNIWNVNALPDKKEKYNDRLKRLGKLIESLQVDVFGFQEVRLDVVEKTAKQKSKDQKRHKKKHKKKSTQFQVSQLASILPDYQFVYQPAMLFTERLLEREEEGLAIFSRYPIVSTDYRLLYKNDSDMDDRNQRICLHAELLVPQLGPVHVFVSHLSLTSKVQERSVVEIWKYMEQFSGIKLLMGDLNAEPHSNTIRFLKGEVSVDDVWTSDLHDTWAVPSSNEALPGLTFSALEEEPVKRIDYIFASCSRHVKVSSAEVIIDNDICFLPCSDHHLLMSVLNPSIF